MALTKDARTEDPVSVSDSGEGRLGSWIVLALAIAALLVAFGWTFLNDPSISAPTRDPAWYTWRANLLMHDSPGLIAREWGPFSMFSGGYRVSVPLFGAMLVRVAGIDGVARAQVHRLVAAGDRSELAVVFLRLLAVHTFEDVVVFLLEAARALQIRIGSTDHAAPDITARQDPLVLGEHLDPRELEVHRVRG